MADDADRTGDREELEFELWQKRRKQVEAMRAVSDDCVECGDEIPLQRQSATGGTEFCVTCAERQEKTRRHYR